VSVLRRALGIAHEERAASVTLLPSAAGRVPEMPDGYGQPGAGAWGEGMVWHASPSAVVTTGASMSLSAVFGCLRLLSEAIATLPLQTFTREGGVRKPYYPVPDYLLFDPPLMSRVVYLSQIMLSLLTDGNAFVATVRDPMGVPIALVPLSPDLVTVKRVRGRIGFEVGNYKYDETEIMHITGMMMPGEIRGVSPLRAAREVTDAGLRSQEFYRSVMKNHAVPPAVIEVPSMGGTPEAERAKAAKIAQTWQVTHSGVGSACCSAVRSSRAWPSTPTTCSGSTPASSPCRRWPGSTGSRRT
jgi:phage portal protein BeeE